MSRGNHGDLIFRDDSDREAFLKCLGQAAEKTGWLIHAYVLMGNHYHLLLETPRGNLVAGMKWLQGADTQRFNSRHKLWGHLLQGRYKALNVDGNDKSYFQTVATYIHLNPVRARIVLPDHQRLSTFRWSSYPHYLARPAKRPVWLSVEKRWRAPEQREMTLPGGVVMRRLSRGGPLNAVQNILGNHWNRHGERFAGDGIWENFHSRIGCWMSWAKRRRGRRPRR